MTRGGKQFIKPGSLAKQKKTNYEMVRDETIKENNAVMNALGIKGILGSSKDSLHPKRRSEKGKDIRSDAENDEYRLSTDGDESNDSDDDSFYSFKSKVTKMPPFRLVRSSLQPQGVQNFVPNTVTHSTPQPEVREMTLQSSLEPQPQPEIRDGTARLRLEPQYDLEVGTQPSLPTEGQLQHEATTCRNVGKRGLTRGLYVQRVIDKEGKLLVPIPHEFRAPVGKHVSKLASKIGFEVQSNVPDLSVRNWKAVDDSVKSSLLQRLQDQFDIKGDPNDVNKAITTRCGRRLSNHTYKLHKKFKKLKDTKGEGHARRYPPKGVSMEQWINLIDEKWTNSFWKGRSRKNTENRTCLKTNHRCGSKSIPTRVHEYAKNHDGQLQNFAEFYKETHFNADTEHWISPECEDNYDKMVQIEVERKEKGEIPMTQEQMSVSVLKGRSGYVKGFGMRSSSNIRTISDVGTSNECVTRLEMKIEAQNERIAELLEANKLQQQVTTAMMSFLREKGYIMQIGGAGISSTD